MLTSELVVARVVSGQLRLSRLDGPKVAAARGLVSTYVECVTASVERSRAGVDASLSAVVVPAEIRPHAPALRKLVLDLCAFDEGNVADAEALRRGLFSRASALRKSRGLVAEDRAQILSEVAAECGLSPDQVEALMYGDLKSERRLVSVRKASADDIVRAYPFAQVQAALSRAVSVTFDIKAHSQAGYRAVFKALKWRLLLYELSREQGGYRLRVSGPFSLFESVTRYGRELAFFLSTLQAHCDWSLRAEVLWGKSKKAASLVASGEPTWGSEHAESAPPEVDSLANAVRRLRPDWGVGVAKTVLDLKGVGLAVPDLTFKVSGRSVHLELLGYWSRDAVFRRVELARAGLTENVIFAVNKKLRVREEALEPTPHACLYVYKTTPSARAIVEKVEGLLSS